MRFKPNEARTEARRMYAEYLAKLHLIYILTIKCKSPEEAKSLKKLETLEYRKAMKRLKKSSLTLKSDKRFLKAEHSAERKFLRKNLAKHVLLSRARREAGIAAIA